MRRLSLTSDSVAGHDWSLSATSAVPAEWSAIADRSFPATVPGEVHIDLLAAGAIPDPFDGDNESALQWIGRTDWRYSVDFDWQPGDEARHELVAEGLDTFATLVLNGTEVGRTANQHTWHRFDVGAHLQPGSNRLEIIFAAPVTAAEQASEAIGPRPAAYPHPYNAVRKMASSYGWDWGPDLAGAGIWKPIRIESWDTARLAAVRPLAGVENGIGVLQTEIDLEWLDGDTPVAVTVEIAGRTIEKVVDPRTPHLSLRTELPEVELWWPRGYGDQPLYPVEVHLRPSTGSGSGSRGSGSGSGGSAGPSTSSGNGPSTGSGNGRDESIDRWDGRVGFRTLRLSTEPDAAGTEFVISVNDQPVYVKGYNWIPDDAFLTRIDPDRYRESIMDAYDSGANLLRIWGGGIYESQYFYRACDELGILVWQDFLFACAAYPEEEPLYSEVVEEARQAITRLAEHPSLAIWNGNNENIWGYVDWGWRQQLGDRTWGDGYYQTLLPKLVAELDPRTPYSAGSPYSFLPYSHPNDGQHGSMHIWDVWNRVDYTTYRSHRPRFVAEFGFQGPPAWSTLTGVVHDQPLDPYGPQMLVHQKAADGNLKLERGLGDHLPHWRTEPEVAIDDWHWLTQLNQARAIRFGIEHFRSLAPYNTGAVLWQLNDNWPVISWAAVDYRHIRKPLWYATRDAFADRLLTIQPRPDVDHDPGSERPTLVMHNDSGQVWAGELIITRRSTGHGSELLAEQRLDFHLDARSSLTVALDGDVITAGDPTAEFVEARTEGSRPAHWYFVEDPQLQLAADGYRVTVTGGRSGEDGEDGYRVTVQADALVKDLALFPDRLDRNARVDSCLITLRAGESHTFTVTGATGLDEGALTTRPVLRSVNDTVNA